MANQPFDREIINTRERPLSGDINTAQTELDRSVRASVEALMLSRNTAIGDEVTTQVLVPALSAGFHGVGFKVVASNPVGLSVDILPGLGWYNSNISESSIGGITGLDDPDPIRPLVLPTKLAYNLGGASAPDGANPRIDIIEVKMARAVGDPTTRDVLNPGTGIFAPATVNKTLSYVNSPITTNGAGGINYKTGVAAGVPVAPAVSAGYVKIGEVLVNALTPNIIQNKCLDRRRILSPGGFTGVMGVLNGGNTVQSCRGAPGIQITSTLAGLITTIYIFRGQLFGVVFGHFQQIQLGGTFNNLRINAISSNLVTAPVQAALAAATPPLNVAIGQDYYQIDVAHETVVVNMLYHLMISDY